MKVLRNAYERAVRPLSAVLVNRRETRAEEISDSPQRPWGGRPRLPPHAGYLSVATVPLSATPAMRPPAWQSYSVALENVACL
jgi:hypothetical protein